MRVALVSPYSWTYPGGVTRHIEALAVELLGSGHEVRVLAPYDEDSSRAAWFHRGARPQRREKPEWLVPLGGTVGFAANGAVSNLAITPHAVAMLRQELRTGKFDVIHLHEPVAPILCWHALSLSYAPLVGTFHTYNEKQWPHWMAAGFGARRLFNHLAKRIAVSEAAEWMGKRFWGGKYTVIPNGVVLPEGGVPDPSVRLPGEPLRIVFVGQAVERKGLPILLRAFEALRDQIPVELTVVGVNRDEIAPLLLDSAGVTALGRVCDDEKFAQIKAADLLCAPSLRGESFGMVLTEAFAAGTPVVASNIAGYRDVVTDNHDGLLIPPADPTALAQTLRVLANDPAKLQRLALEARCSAHKYAWPRIAEKVVDVYDQARSIPSPEGLFQRAGVRMGTIPADLGPRIPARRIQRLDPLPSLRSSGQKWAKQLRVLVAIAVATALAYLAIDNVDIGSTVNMIRSVFESSPIWVLVALFVMCSSMVLRAVSWQATLKAALPNGIVRFVDAMQGTSIGVLMSATLPARLGEVSRALVVARRLGRPREVLPVVIGTLVSQTILNVLALIILGSIMFFSVGFFDSPQQALIWYSVAPILLICLVFVLPAILRERRSASWVGRVRNVARDAFVKVRLGFKVFRSLPLGSLATVTQLCAWVLQWLSCYLLLVALNIDHVAGLTAAASILFAVNVTAVIPITPSNVLVFQWACFQVLTTLYGVGDAQAVAYGVILQGVEIATAILLGVPALVKEGLSWREVKMRALYTAPVVLKPANQQKDAVIKDHAGRA